MKLFLFRLIQILIILTPIGVMAWLLYQELVPSGVFVVKHPVNTPSPFIDQLLPDARVGAPYQDENGDWVQSIMGDPVYFFAHPHRDFIRAEIELWFKNTYVPIVELGPLVDVAAESYDLRPVQNLLIDRSSWSRVEQDGIILLQREPTYDSVDAFLTATPERSRIATYNYTLPDPYRIAEYRFSSLEQTVDVSLRGFHEFETYIKDETLRFDIRFMDMNRKNGSDPVIALVLNENGDPVSEVRVADDENMSDDARPSSLRQLLLEVPNLPEGVYKVQLKAERDIFFRTITTQQQKLTFLTNVYLADEVAYREPNKPVRFWTEAKHLRFVTQHAESMQEVRVGEGLVRMVEPYLEYSYEVPDVGVVSVDVPRGDTIVRSDGRIAFSPEALFNPDPVRLYADTDLDRLNVDFVIATYTSPEMIGEWFVQVLSFDMTRVADFEETWKFALSAPGIEESAGRFLIRKVNMTWWSEPLTWVRFIGEIRETIWNR